MVKHKLPIILFQSLRDCPNKHKIILDQNQSTLIEIVKRARRGSPDQTYSIKIVGLAKENCSRIKICFHRCDDRSTPIRVIKYWLNWMLAFMLKIESARFCIIKKIFKIIKEKLNPLELLTAANSFHVTLDVRMTESSSGAQDSFGSG